MKRGVRLVGISTLLLLAACRDGGAAAGGATPSSGSSGLGGLHLQVTPASGPVGTEVTITGPDCRSTPGQARTLLSGQVLRGPAAEIFGSVTVQWIAAAPFSVSFMIPALAGQINGLGGGPIQPGDQIRFVSAPAVCASDGFTVSASAP